MKRHQANKKGFIRYMAIFLLILTLAFFYAKSDSIIEKPLVAIPLMIPVVLILWIYFDTSYKVENKRLFYRSGFLRGAIEIRNIREIVKGKTQWVGLRKPALAIGGLIVKYNKFDEVYIAPQSNDNMISDLLEINPEIVISNR